MSNSSKKVYIFILLTYSLTSIFFFILYSIGGVNNPATFNLIGLSMIIPFLSCIIVQKLLFKQSLRNSFNVSLKFNIWFPISIFIPILISIIINLISIKKFGSIIFSFDSFLTNILIGLSIASFSALMEELSWRGFLYNELSYLSLFKVLTFISFVWAFWHTPVAILYKYPTIPLIGSIINFIQMFFISLIITYIRYKSKSVLAASFSHGLFNTLVLSSCISKIDSIFISILLSALIVFILFIYEFKASIK